MPQIIPSAHCRVAKIVAIGIAIKLAIGVVAYVLLIDMHQLATATL